MKKVIIILCIMCLAALWVAPAAWATDEFVEFACKCKGKLIERGDAKIYGRYCGNGFRGASKGALEKGISASMLDHYIPPAVSGSVKSGNGCGYFSQSGWNCGKMQGDSPPSCIND